MVKASEVEQRIISSHPYRDCRSISVPEIMRWRFRDKDFNQIKPTREAVCEAFRQLISRGLATKVKDGVIVRIGANKKEIARPWRTISNEELGIEPLLETSANDADWTFYSTHYADAGQNTNR